MFRKYEERIQKWLDNSRKALLIYGARQVGKTYLIRKMLEQNQVPYFEINLLEREDVVKAIRSIADVTELSARLAMYSDKALPEKEGIIFLDEVQRYPEIVTKIKFLVDEGRFRYILSGSNLGVELEGIRSMPVGYAEQWQMYPMDLYEFSLNLGITEQQWAYVRECLKEEKPVDEIIHQKMMRVFYYYLVSGGMPAVVRVFIDKHNLLELKAEQQNIVNQYKADFIKYEAADRRLRILAIYDSIPAQLRKQDLRFVFTYLNKELKFDRYEQSFLWLKDAGVSIPIFQAEAVESPLELSRSTNRFKLFDSDVGLLVSHYPPEARQALLGAGENAELNNGALFENFVAQELTAAEIPAYYFKSTKIGEIDFLIEDFGGVLPLEVKSGKDYQKHTALDHLMKNEVYRVKRAVVLSRFNLKREGDILYLPIYMTGLLKGTEPEVSFTIEL
ncbi:MAG: AAA family ATPase [Oscillospiraceae bacterium]|nr:AAA family ATPase [Oscillospiraceae bacterium]